MRRLRARGTTILVIVSVLLLVACTAAPPVPTVAAPSPSPTLSPLPSPSLTGTPSSTQTSTPTTTFSSTSTTTATNTLTPSPTPTSIDGGIQIEVVTGSTTHVFLAPNQTANVVADTSEIVLLIHYPVVLGTTDQAGFHPYAATVTIDPADWQVQQGNQPDGTTLNEHLVGGGSGPYRVTVTLPQASSTISFILNIAVPTATPTVTLPAAIPTAIPTGGATNTNPSVVTLASAGQTIQLHVGDTFLLNLGEGWDWTVNVSNPAVVSRVVNILVIRGAQGVYKANRPGTATLTAVGDPPCRKSTPPCMAPSRAFQVQIVVQ
jgi:hypothetical protein